MIQHLYVHRGWRSLRNSAFVAGVLVGALALTEAKAVGAEGSPSRLLPSNGLYAYIEYDGLATHSAAWKATAAYDILGKTAAGATLGDVTRQLVDTFSKNLPTQKFSGSEIWAIQEHLVDHGFALAFYDDKGSKSAVFVLKSVGKPGPRQIERVRRYILMADDSKPLPSSTPLRGRAVFKFGDQQAAVREQDKNAQAQPNVTAVPPFTQTDSPSLLTTWFEANDLIIVKGPTNDWPTLIQGDGAAKEELAARHKARVSAVLDAFDDKQARVSAHPVYVAALAQGRDLAGFEANGLFLAEPIKAGDGIQSLVLTGGYEESFERVFLETFGLHRARRVFGRWGFRGKSLLTDVRFEAPQPWNRVGEMLNPATLRKDRLPPIPEGSGALAVGSFRQTDLREAVAPLLSVVSPEYRPILDATERAIVDLTTRQFRDEVFRHLGPTWCMYASSNVRPGAKGSADPAFLIEVDDSDAVAKLLDEIMSRANAYFREQRPGDGPPAMAFERLPSPERGFRLTSPTSAVPWLSDQLQPAILLGKSFLSVAANPGLARAAIAGETRKASRLNPTGELAKSLACLPEKLSLLVVGNPRDSFWPEAIASSPTTAGPFLNMFLGLPVAELPADAQDSDLLGLLGVKRTQAPVASELRDRLFPSVIAATVDDRSFRVIALEALPFAFLGPEIAADKTGSSKTLTIDLKFRPGK